MDNKKTGTGKYPKTSAPTSKIPKNAKMTTTGGVGKGGGMKGGKKMC